jgi:hypothetical protein
MASRGISLGRIIEWFRTCDAEEGTFALQRAGTILAERKSLLEPGRVSMRKKPSHHRKPTVSAPLTPQGEAEKAASA